MKFPILILPLAGLLGGAVLPAAPAPTADRWSLEPTGGISWEPTPRAEHYDNIEMAGKQVAVIVNYGLDARDRLQVSREIIWPMLRFEPQGTRSHLKLSFSADAEPRLLIDRQLVGAARLRRVDLDGVVRLAGHFAENVTFVRTLFPSTELPVVIEYTEVTNRTARPITFEVEANRRRIETAADRGVTGAYVVTSEVEGIGERTLAPGQSTSFAVFFRARRADVPPANIDPLAELHRRRARVNRVLTEMMLETPEPELNTAFAFAKIRATESIFATKGGLFHSPGGGNYYAALWANDQAEYVGPFLAMLADPDAREAGITTYRQFARFMNPDYTPMPSSIVAEGEGTWHGAGDRGDMAMIAYGAARFALARGDRATAEELWPLIAWCLEYCRRQLTADGVVASDSDELENRFPSGRANLCTSSLYYDALLSAADLGAELNQPAAMALTYRDQAQALRAAIERYFGATVEGFATYRYFDQTHPSPAARHAHYADEPDHLRAWICVPLTVGIYDRAAATIDALFSPRLWTVDGLATEAGQVTFWDRSTLYALRGVFAAGATTRAHDYLRYYTNRRLRGDHVPYPVEAFPEGNQRHLSAESALYCRIFTEGLFGLRPTGLDTFDLTPRLPDEWPAMALRAVHAFGTTFDVEVARAGEQLQVVVRRPGGAPRNFRVKPGATLSIHP